MSLSLQGRKVLLVGAAGGIGAACAHRIAALGGMLVLNDVSDLTPLAEELRQHHGVEPATCRADPGTTAGAEAVIAAAADADALVFLAGICPTADWMTDPDWETVFDEVMRINVFSCFALVRGLLPRMAARGRGSIILVGSSAARSGGLPADIQAHYVASKGALHSLVRHLARRAVRQGVLVNGVAPGAIATGMNASVAHQPDNYPLRRMGRAEEVAWPIAFLCSDAASYICGAVLDVNGGTFIA